MKFPRTLWDLLRGPNRAPAHAASPTRRQRQTAQQDRYDQLVDQMKTTWSIRIHKWRNSTSGCAWELRDRQGNITRMIEAPYPRGPMSCVIFLHEVGHHAMGFNCGQPRCMEEHLAWDWAIREMTARGFNVTDRVRTRRDAAMRYALHKAVRRGIKRIPSELVQWLPEGVEVATIS
ncbi:MAG: hypothetical protein HOI89_11280 [Phycisphaerae bacterium]|nr:hypothetical protein [Phycisphaerae bacterium]MDG2477439.1 hypothetical protein [Phycisphaerales bacterium]